MPVGLPKFAVAVLFLICPLLAGCKSPEERAAAAFEQAIQLVEEGDVARAGVAFNNVFKYAPDNTEAREIYANFLRSSGESQHASRQYLRLLEQDPDHLSALIAMTELAMESYGWEVAQMHLARAKKIAPAKKEILALDQVMDYAQAVGAADKQAQIKSIEGMANAASETPLLPLSRALSDGWLRLNDPDAALSVIDTGLLRWPNDRSLHDQRLLALQALEKPDKVAAQFRAMIELFPENRNIATRYVDWLARDDQLAVAESFLRQRATDTKDEVARTLDLIEFLATWKGPDAVLADLDVLVDSDADPLLFRAMRASVVFQTGAREDAIAELKAIVAEAEVSPVDSVRSDTARYRIVLAQMLDDIGDRAGAEAAVALVISQHPNMTEAAQLQAKFLLDKGQNTDAISTLRAALGSVDSDPQLLLLLARAHSAQGADALATRTLSLAFAASGQSPDIALIFASHLAQDARTGSAIDVLTRALSTQPRHPGLLAALANLYIEQGDWNRAASIATTLRRLDAGPAPARAADQLDLALLAARAPLSEALKTLEALDATDQGGSMAYLSLIQAYIAAGRADDARRVLDQGLEAAPENALLLAISARLAVAQGQSARAIETYRSLIAGEPDSEYLWISLAQAVATESDTEAVLAILDEGLTARPNSPRLEWERALVLHQADRPEEAIEAYERVLEHAPSNLPAVNNLANLLSTTRQDEESLTRAADLSKALERSDIPQFRNTLGWIRFRQGDVSAAVVLLVPAAETLSTDPLVQIQAAEALIAASQGQRAQAFLTRAMDLVVPDSVLADRAREGMDAIAALGTAKEG